MKFTKEIKENWLKNLKSGKYNQGFTALVVDENNNNLSENTDEEKFHCCLGVLGDCTDGLNNYSINAVDDPYTFLNNTIGAVFTQNLYETNDDFDYQKTGKRDYSNIIPLIKKLETQN